MNANGTRTSKDIGNKSSTFTLVDTGDFNADGIADILWRKGSSNSLWLMHADGSHTYQAVSAKSTAYTLQ